MAPIPRRLTSRRNASLAAGLLSLLLASLPAPAQTTSTWLQRLRELLSIQPRVAVAGSRSLSAGSSSNTICLISPWRAAVVDGTVTAITPSGVPPIVTREPLAEVQILKGNAMLWRRRASSSQPIQTPLAWPLDSLQPGESVNLKLRPWQRSGGGFADIQLSRSTAATDAAPNLTEENPERWMDQIQRLSEKGQPAAAFELLFRGSLAGIPDLRRQANELIGNACTKGRSRQRLQIRGAAPLTIPMTSTPI